jgi:hypothetical protein
MIKRSAFNSEEWREVILAPFWMAVILCEKSLRPVPEMHALFLSELSDPALYVRFARVVFFY